MIAPTIRKNTAKDVVVESIQKYIIDNKLGVGSPLPSESEISERLGISRGIVRDGLQHFKTLGIIDAKPKTGAFVKSLMPANPFEGYIPYLKARSKTVSEVGMLRSVLECGLIPIWIQRTTDEDLRQLTKLAERFNEVDLNEADRDFHCYLLEMSGNEIITSLTPLVKAFFNETHSDDGGSAEIRGHVHRDWHMRYVDGIRNKDVEALRTEVEKHHHGYLKY